MTKSTLATQREQDEDLCGRLVRNSGYRNENWQCIVDPDFLTQAAARIRQLSQDLQEACHDRDRYQAEVERMGWQPIETAPKDGTQVLVGRFVKECPYGKNGRVRADFWDAKRRGWTVWDRFNAQYWPPTHWQPLPPPPGEK